MTTLVAPALAALSSYTSYLSYQSIIRVRTYEEKIEKAAKYSNIADDQLWQTRKTEGAGAIAAFLSVTTSAYLSISSYTRSSPPTLPITLTLSGVNIAATLFAADTISRFWRGKAKIPLVDNFNESITIMAKMTRCLWLMGCGWGMLGVVVGLSALTGIGGSA